VRPIREKKYPRWLPGCVNHPGIFAQCVFSFTRLSNGEFYHPCVKLRRLYAGLDGRPGDPFPWAAAWPPPVGPDRRDDKGALRYADRGLIGDWRTIAPGDIAFEMLER